MNDTMGLSADEIFQHLEKDTGITRIVTDSPQTEEDFLFGNSTVTYPTTETSIVGDAGEYQAIIDDMQIQHQATIDDLLKKINILENNPSNSNGNDVNYLLKIMNMVIKKIEKGAYDKAIIDLSMTLDEFKK